ncbi:MAG: uroporphyrinogen decarboxylase [Burkholderiaceae bacterium]
MTFAPLQNDSFLRACLGQATPHTPVWLMRQAGRYLPEYCATRAKAGSFMGLATNVDYATEVTLQPLARYPLDAAILFSDILTVPDAMGLGLSFQQGEGPKFERVVRDEAAVARLAVPDMARLRYVFDAVASIRKALAGRVPLIGFSGSPWTLACYMVEGGGSQDYRQVKTLMYARPDLMHRVLAVNADSVAVYLNAQIDAGAQAVMIFDSWGGVLADGAFQDFSLAYTARVLGQLKRTGADGGVVPRIVFTKGGGLWLQDMRGLACDVLGLDWTLDLGRARHVLEGQETADSIAAGAYPASASASFDLENPRPTALQGNIDPNVLFAPPDAIRAEARRVLEAFGRPHADAATRGIGHVFNLGHGISQFTPPEHVAHLVDEVHAHSRRLRAAA